MTLGQAKLSSTAETPLVLAALPKHSRLSFCRRRTVSRVKAVLVEVIIQI